MTHDSLVMDNLPLHKVNGVSETIKAVGATIVYLPPYSPDLNPIELLWSKRKAFLRKRKVRTKELLDDAIAAALDSISISEIAHWFAHDGYMLPLVSLL